MVGNFFRQFRQRREMRQAARFSLQDRLNDFRALHGSYTPESARNATENAFRNIVERFKP